MTPSSGTRTELSCLLAWLAPQLARPGSSRHSQEVPWHRVIHALLLQTITHITLVYYFGPGTCKHRSAVRCCQDVEGRQRITQQGASASLIQHFYSAPDGC